MPPEKKLGEAPRRNSMKKKRPVSVIKQGLFLSQEHNLLKSKQENRIEMQPKPRKSSKKSSNSRTIEIDKTESKLVKI